MQLISYMLHSPFGFHKTLFLFRISLNLCPQTNGNVLGLRNLFHLRLRMYGLWNIEWRFDTTLHKRYFKIYPCYQFQLSQWPFSFKFCFNYFWSVLNFFFHNCVMFTHFLKLILECYLHRKSFSQSWFI